LGKARPVRLLSLPRGEGRLSLSLAGNTSLSGLPQKSCLAFVLSASSAPSPPSNRLFVRKFFASSSFYNLWRRFPNKALKDLDRPALEMASSQAPSSFPAGGIYFLVKVNLIAVVGIQPIKGYVTLVSMQERRTSSGCDCLIDRTQPSFSPFYSRFSAH